MVESNVLAVSTCTSYSKSCPPAEVPVKTSWGLVFAVSDVSVGKLKATVGTAKVVVVLLDVDVEVVCAVANTQP